MVIPKEIRRTQRIRQGDALEILKQNKNKLVYGGVMHCFAGSREIAAEMQETVQDHLRSYALGHHRTANRLGARPTGNLEDAKVEASIDTAGATVTVKAASTPLSAMT